VFTNRYALAVEIEDNLFEIFDVLYIEKESGMDLALKKATAINTSAISIPIKSKIKIGDFLNQNNLLFNLKSHEVEISDENTIYLIINNNEVVSFLLHQKEDPNDKKYQAAFESNVIVIDVSLENNVGLGDLWDRQKIIKMV
jgi:hypothetical protein